MWKAKVTDKHGKVHEFIARELETVEEWVSNGIKSSIWGQGKRSKTVASVGPGMTVVGSKTVLNAKSETITLHDVILDPEYTVQIFQTDDIEDIRKERNRLLEGSDWLFIADVPVPSKYRLIYRTYRQYLRDVPNRNYKKIEYIDHWLRREHPNEFLDGGKAEEMIKIFNSNLKEK